MSVGSKDQKVGIVIEGGHKAEGQDAHSPGENDGPGYKGHYRVFESYATNGKSHRPHVIPLVGKVGDENTINLFNRVGLLVHATESKDGGDFIKIVDRSEYCAQVKDGGASLLYGSLTDTIHPEVGGKLHTVRS